MRVHVKLFAILREVAGTGDQTLELPEDATVGRVRDRLLAMYPPLARHLPRVAYAVNRAYAPLETRLHDADEVALIPPVSGG